jgi:hypothetical protein
VDRSWVGRGVANQRNREGVAHGAEPITRVGAYVQPRSPAGARKLPGARDGRLQGRARALGKQGHPKRRPTGDQIQRVEPVRPRAELDGDDGVPSPTSGRTQLFGMRPCVRVSDAK